MKILVRDFNNDVWQEAEFDGFNNNKMFPVKANLINWMQWMSLDPDYVGKEKKRKKKENKIKK